MSGFGSANEITDAQVELLKTFNGKQYLVLGVSPDTNSGIIYDIATGLLGRVHKMVIDSAIAQGRVVNANEQGELDISATRLKALEEGKYDITGAIYVFKRYREEGQNNAKGYLVLVVKTSGVELKRFSTAVMHNQFDMPTVVLNAKLVSKGDISYVAGIVREIEDYSIRDVKDAKNQMLMAKPDNGGQTLKKQEDRETVSQRPSLQEQLDTRAQEAREKLQPSLNDQLRAMDDSRKPKVSKDKALHFLKRILKAQATRFAYTYTLFKDVAWQEVTYDSTKVKFIRRMVDEVMSVDGEYLYMLAKKAMTSEKTFVIALRAVEFYVLTQKKWAESGKPLANNELFADFLNEVRNIEEAIEQQLRGEKVKGVRRMSIRLPRNELYRNKKYRESDGGLEILGVPETRRFLQELTHYWINHSEGQGAVKNHYAQAKHIIEARLNLTVAETYNEVQSIYAALSYHDKLPRRFYIPDRIGNAEDDKARNDKGYRELPRVGEYHSQLYPSTASTGDLTKVNWKSEESLHMFGLSYDEKIGDKGSEEVSLFFGMRGVYHPYTGIDSRFERFLHKPAFQAYGTGYIILVRSIAMLVKQILEISSLQKERAAVLERLLLLLALYNKNAAAQIFLKVCENIPGVVDEAMSIGSKIRRNSDKSYMINEAERQFDFFVNDVKNMSSESQLYMVTLTSTGGKITPNGLGVELAYIYAPMVPYKTYARPLSEIDNEEVVHLFNKYTKTDMLLGKSIYSTQTEYPNKGGKTRAVRKRP